jgi:hypothetical protein
MENLFETLGGILRPEQSQQKTEYLIYEKLSECTREYRRLPGGISVVGSVEAASADAALDWWLLDKADAYGITRYHGKWQEDCSERMVWEPGDTVADFGDYTVHATPLADVESSSHLEQAAIKANIIEPEAE